MTIGSLRLKNKNLSAFTLKSIAIIAMLIDHTGAILIDCIILRIIGRLTLPIMAFFIAEGYYKTHDIKAYLKRMLIFALISVPPFYFAFGRFGNVMFTLLFALCILWIWDNIDSYLLRCLISLVFLCASLFCDWSAFGVLFVLLFAFFRTDFKKQAIAFTILSLIMVFADMISIFINSGPVLGALKPVYQLAVLLALPLLYKYSGERGKDMRWLFYSFYPLHLLVLSLVRLLIYLSV